jgi:hypothetical protein
MRYATVAEAYSINVCDATRCETIRLLRSAVGLRSAALIDRVRRR